METTDISVLHDAIARNMAAVLSLPSAGMLRHRKTRFLSMTTDSIWVEVLEEDRPHLNELIANATPVGVSFKASSLKQMFAAPMVERRDDYAVNADTHVCAARLEMPAIVRPLQRRSSYRVRFLGDTNFSLNVWRIPPRVPVNEKPPHSAKVQTELIDLSMGGLGVFFLGSDGQKPRICEADRLRVQLTAGTVELLVEGSMRHPHPGADPAKLKAGIAFKTMENDLEGRQNLAKLARMVGDLQRTEMRRTRLGVA